MVHHTDVVVDIYNVRIHFIFLPEKHTEQNDHTSTQPAVNTHSTKWPHTYNLLSTHTAQNDHTHTTCCQHTQHKMTTHIQPAVNTHSTKWPHTYNLLSKHIMKWPHTHNLLSRQQGIVTYDYITKYTTCCQHHIYLLSKHMRNDYAHTTCSVIIFMPLCTSGGVYVPSIYLHTIWE